MRGNFANSNMDLHESAAGAAGLGCAVVITNSVPPSPSPFRFPPAAAYPAGGRCRIATMTEEPENRRDFTVLYRATLTAMF
jgi:hypothetical protein